MFCMYKEKSFQQLLFGINIIWTLTVNGFMDIGKNVQQLSWENHSVVGRLAMCLTNDQM